MTKLKFDVSLFNKLKNNEEKEEYLLNYFRSVLGTDKEEHNDN